MTIVQFPEYRQHDMMRVEVNNAMMGLLAGAQLAVHTLQLTEGSEQLLPKIFPAVAHIGRFNITTSTARRILIEADTHLGAMSVLYALALHEDYVKTCLDFFVRAGLASRGEIKDLGLNGSHEWIQARAGELLPADTLEQFHVLRLMRNCLVHRGGRASQGLIEEVGRMGSDAESSWEEVVGRSPRALNLNDRVEFSHGELIMTLA